MMVSLYDYTDYRRFLRDLFLRMKEKNPRFSYRAFNRHAGFKSSASLKLILDGKRNLGEEGILVLAKGLQLNDEERRYFETLVKFTQAGDREEKDYYFRELSQDKRFLSAKPLTIAQYRLFSHWYYVAILELVRIETSKRKNAQWLFSRLNPRVELGEIQRALRDLKRLKLVTEDAEGSLQRRETMLTTEDEVRSIAVANFHTQMSHLAARAVAKEKARDREFSALTIVSSEQGFQKIKGEIQKFRKRLHFLLEQSDRSAKTMVTHLNLQLFKLSRTIFLIFLVVGLGCNPEPLPGIEVGNPNLEGKTLRIIPEEGPEEGKEIYQVTVADETTAVVERFRVLNGGGEPVFVERTAVPYTQSSETLGLSAVFADSRAIDVQVTIEENGTTVSGILRLDDAVVEACFDFPDLSPVCEPNGDPQPPPAVETEPISEEGNSTTSKFPFYPRIVLPDSSEDSPAQDDPCVTCFPQDLGAPEAFEDIAQSPDFYF